MSIITEREGGAGEYEEVTIPAAPSAGRGWSVLRRRSVLPSRRAVLQVQSRPELSVPEDLARWYTERGFHFYVADQRPAGGQEQAGRLRRKVLQARFRMLDTACQHLREAEGISSVLISAQGADALAVALWCDARRDIGPADALIFSDPQFGRRLRRGLHIACPVLVLAPAAQPGGQGLATLGPHVTWLGLASAERKALFDEMGRWLGAYMYGPVRDQLL